MFGKEENLMLDYSYTELDNDIEYFFNLTCLKNRETEVVENSYFYAECEEEPHMFLHHLKIILYEVKHHILTEKLKKDFIQYEKRWHAGEFQNDILPEDIPIIEKDIEYIKSVLKL